MSIGAIIKQRRKAARLTQKELAQKCGLSRNSIYKYEKGEMIPKIEHLQTISKVLAFNPSDYLSSLSDGNYLLQETFTEKKIHSDEWRFINFVNLVGYNITYEDEENYHVQNKSAVNYYVPNEKMNSLRNKIVDYIDCVFTKALTECPLAPTEK